MCQWMINTDLSKLRPMVLMGLRNYLPDDNSTALNGPGPRIRGTRQSRTDFPSRSDRNADIAASSNGKSNGLSCYTSRMTNRFSLANA